jgi:hypothetical protein
VTWSRQLGGLRRLATTVPALCVAIVLAMAAPAVATATPDHPADAFVHPLNTTFGYGSTAGYTDDEDPNIFCQGAAENDYAAHTVWHRFTGTGGPVKVSSYGSQFPTVLFVYDAAGNAPGTALVCDGPFGNETHRAQVVVDTTAGAQYLVQAGGCSTSNATSSPPACESSIGAALAETGPLDITVLGNDARAFPELLAPGSPVTRTNYGAIIDAGETSSCQGTSYNSTVWFALDAPEKGKVLLTLTGHDLVLTAFRGNEVVPVACSAVKTPGTLGTTLSFDVPSSGRYLVQVGSPSANPNYSSDFSLAYGFAADTDRDGDRDPNATDCAPDDPAIGHTLNEVPNNDVDENCDNVKAFDRDGDGHLAPTAGDDCDDSNANRHPGLFDKPGDGIDQDCVNGKAVSRLEKPRATFVGGGSISVNGRPIKYAAEGMRLDDLTKGAKVSIAICHPRCKTRRFTAKSTRKRIWFKPRHQQIVLTGATIAIKVYRAGKDDVAGAYLRLKLVKSGVRQCGGALRNGKSGIAGKACRPR